VKDAKKKLNEIQVKIDSNGQNEVIFEQEKLAQINLHKALDIEEAY